jgi:ATP-dependent DNA ligase
LSRRGFFDSGEGTRYIVALCLCCVLSSRACRLLTTARPRGSNWIHEIKHDGYRLMARRDPVGIRLITRRGNDWSTRFPLVVEAVNHLKVRSCLIDGEVVCCDERGVAAFHVLRHRRNEVQAFLYAFDLLELNGTDLRREPIEVRKAMLANILRKPRGTIE